MATSEEEAVPAAGASSGATALLNDEQKEMLAMFKAVVGSEEDEVAVQFLADHSWNLEHAINAFLGGGGAPSPRAEPPMVQGFSAGPGGLGSDNPASVMAAVAAADHVMAANAVAGADARLPQPEQPSIGPDIAGTLSSIPGVGLAWNLVSGVVGTTARVAGALGNLIPLGDEEEAPPEEPVGAAQWLVDRFERQYGEQHPDFLRCSYRDALSRAREELKFLLVYLHSEMHENTDEFCRDVLGSELLAEFVNDNFLIWAGDTRSTEGFAVSGQLHASNYPFLAVVADVGSGPPRVVDVLQGRTTTEAVVAKLTNVLENRGPMLVAARADRDERLAAQRIREEQDAAYQEALEADQRREAEEAAARAAEQEAAARAAEEAAAAERAAEELEKQRVAMAATFEDEPAAGPDVCTLRVRLGDGSQVTRRFAKTDTLQRVLDLAFSKGFDVSNCMLVTNFPRTEFPDMSKTMEQVGWMPQAAVFIAERT